MIEEVRNQMNNGNYTIVQRQKVLPDKAILLTVWQMKRKRDIQF